MKKLLLPLLSLLAIGSAANAETLTETLSQNEFKNSGTTYAEYTYTSSTTGISYFGQMAGDKSSLQLRSNNNNSGIVVTANPNGYVLTNVEVKWNDATATARVLDVYGNDQAYTKATELYNKATAGTLIGSIKKAENEPLASTDGYPFIGLRSNSGAMYITSITLTWESSSDNRKPAELSFAETAVTTTLSKGTYTQAVTNPNNLTVTYSSSDTDVATVDAATGTVTLKAAGSTTITATSAATDEYKAGTASYTLSIASGAKSIAELIAGENNAQWVIDFPMTVGFVKGSNIFVTDGKDWIQIYNANSYAAGNVIPAGWSAKYTLYNGVTPELTNCVGLPESTENAVVDYKEYTNAADVTVANVNEVLILKKVVLAEASPATKANFTGTMNGAEVNLRNNYEIESVEAGTYDIKVVCTVYNNAPSLYVIEYIADTTDNRKPAELSFAEATVSVSLSQGTYTQAVTNPNNLTVTYSSSDPDVATVDAATGTVTLKASGSTKITATSAATDEYKEGSASYTLNIPAEAKSIADLIAGENNAPWVIDFPMTVGFVKGSNIFATDGTGWIQIYNANTYEAGSVIPAGWSATYSLYSNVTPQLSKCVGLPESTETAVVNYKEYDNAADVAVANVNEVLILKSVTLAEASPATKSNFTGTMNGGEVSLRNNYQIESVEAGTYDIKVVCTIYNNATSLYVIEFMPETSGVDDVIADGEQNGEVEYYNLQGVRVENPANGLYIRKQGSDVKKVLVK